MKLTKIIQGDALTELQKIPDQRVHCCVTSPPYWNLRNYKMEGQFGLEDTPDKYVANLVQVFREVWRVLRDDGTLWLNLGDSYASTDRTHDRRDDNPPDGLRSKSLIGIPWRVAFALQQDGWILRSDIIWAKGISFNQQYSGSCMPESVRDRPTKAHEYLFLLAKQPRYFWDQEAVREKLNPRKQQQRAKEIAQAAGLTQNHIAAIQAAGITDTGKARVTQTGTDKNTPEVLRLATEAKDVLGGYYREFLFSSTSKNIRDVWTINPEPFSSAHFAVMPSKLIEPCVKAGTSEAGCCVTCGSPLERQTKTAGWARTCGCDSTKTKPCLVLDPFAGAGTVPLVAARLRRRGLGIELNPEYCKLARNRIRDDALAGPSLWDNMTG